MAAGERRDALRKEQPIAVGVGPGPDQEPASGHRGEGYRHLELRVVAAAGALKGIRPAVVEDVFAHRVRLEIGGEDGGRAAVRAVEDEMLAEPAGLPRRRARLLQGREEIVGEEGVVLDREILAERGRAGLHSLIPKRCQGLVGAAVSRPAGGHGIGAGVPVRARDVAERGHHLERSVTGLGQPNSTFFLAPLSEALDGMRARNLSKGVTGAIGRGYDGR